MIGSWARAAFLVLLPAFGVGGALGTPVLICLAGALSLSPSLLRQALEKRPLAPLALIALAALSITSAVWSDYPAAVQAAKLAVLIPLSLAFTVAAAGDARLVRAGAVAACVVLAILLAIEALGGLPLNGAAQPDTEYGELLRNVSRAASLHLAITWGAVGALMARGGRTWTDIGLLVLAASGFVSLQFGQFANTLGFAAGLLAFFAAFIAPRIVLVAAIGALVLWLVAAPFATPLLVAGLDAQSLPYSWNARLEIWTYICDRIREQPWFGHGLDAARAHEPHVPVHPHSASLQIWFETGVLGVALAAAALLAGGRELIRRFGDNRPAAAAAAGALAALGVVANLSFNLWAEWWLATLFIAAGFVGALGRAPR
jgi:exopolysaccharide production protein ExoQ